MARLEPSSLLQRFASSDFSANPFRKIDTASLALFAGAFRNKGMNPNFLVEGLTEKIERDGRETRHQREKHPTTSIDLRAFHQLTPLAAAHYGVLWGRKPSDGALKHGSDCDQIGRRSGLCRFSDEALLLQALEIVL